MGTVNSCIVSPKEVFKHAILSNAVNIIVFHNHYSGDPTASIEDINTTKRLVDAGNLLGISVVDQIIIGDEDIFLSLREEGIMM
nr:JAB domain-containing protein [Mobilisporobacter senegalensis]